MAHGDAVVPTIPSQVLATYTPQAVCVPTGVRVERHREPDQDAVP